MTKAYRIKNAIETMAPNLTGRFEDRPVGRAITASHFEALLYPNRSLPNTGFVIIMSIVIVVNIFFGLVFALAGAWPVLAFGGIDIALVWFAFKISYRQGRLHERISITQNEINVSRVFPSGHEMRWRLQPYWTQIYIDNPVRHESQLCLISKGETLILGSFLSPEERHSLGRKLSTVLNEIKK